MRNLMMREHNLRPFFYVLMLIFFMFVLVFSKMELRRLNYAFWVKSQQYGRYQDQYYKNLMKHAELSRSERIEKLAHSTLHPAAEGQVVLVIGEKVALTQ